MDPYGEDVIPSDVVGVHAPGRLYGGAQPATVGDGGPERPVPALRPAPQVDVKLEATCCFAHPSSPASYAVCEQHRWGLLIERAHALQRGPLQSKVDFLWDFAKRISQPQKRWCSARL